MIDDLHRAPNGGYDEERLYAVEPWRPVMSDLFSTGSYELDMVLEKLQAGDNVVFLTSDPADYEPFVTSLLAFVCDAPVGLVYVRSSGQLDHLMETLPSATILDLARLDAVDGSDDPAGIRLAELQEELFRVGLQAYYVFDTLTTLEPWLGSPQVDRAFLTLCPMLYRYRSVAYWNLIKGQHSDPAIAAIKDCTQIFLDVERSEDRNSLQVTPLKVWGRYSEAMFRPHRLEVGDEGIRVRTLPVDAGGQESYTRALAEKNRELAEIRDALNRSNEALQQRNRELADLNHLLSEQSRLYQSLRVNLDHLLTLFRAGQDIGSSLVVDQVRRAIVTATLRLFDVNTCRLCVLEPGEAAPINVTQGEMPAWVETDIPLLNALRDRVCRTGAPHSVSSPDGAQGSLALAPVMVRGRCLGTLEVYAPDDRLDAEESRTLLSYLASEASIALDNAHLYRETQVQGEQLRTYVENVITNEEQESRRLAFDLHDGLVQIIVASYQHMQTARAWRHRDPEIEAREIEQGVRLLRQAIDEARRLIGQLRPAGLDDFGLVHALRLYLAPLATDEGRDVSLDVDPDWPELPSSLEAALYRIVQEATTNIRKYADSCRFRIELHNLPDDLVVSIRDWGRGFDPETVSARPEQGMHMGLIGIRERARMWGGRCIIDSQPGRGTVITVTIPRSRALATTEEPT
jgi:signal transduction histidine kinase